MVVVVLEREDAFVRALLVGQEFAERVGVFERGRFPAGSKPQAS
ncbi:MAG: hypothetical protein WDM79_10305 [Terricaulis sp.]